MKEAARNVVARFELGIHQIITFSSVTPPHHHGVASQNIPNQPPETRSEKGARRKARRSKFCDSFSLTRGHGASIFPWATLRQTRLKKDKRTTAQGDLPTYHSAGLNNPTKQRWFRALGPLPRSSIWTVRDISSETFGLFGQRPHSFQPDKRLLSTIEGVPY